MTFKYGSFSLKKFRFFWSKSVSAILRLKRKKKNKVPMATKLEGGGIRP